MQNVIPRLYVKSRGEQTTKLALQLTTAKRKCLLRFTGGCGKMSPADGERLHDYFAQALVGYDGASVFGGSRMLCRDDPTQVVMGITEVPPRLRELCPDMVLLGVAPRVIDLKMVDEGLVLADDPADPYFTVVHPQQDICLVVQVSADCPEIWDAEYQECQRIAQDLRDFAGFTTITVAWNGGGVTEREIRTTAEKGWPVVVVEGSGRKCDELAADKAFLGLRPNVRVASHLDPQTLRHALAVFGAVPERRLQLVRKTSRPA